MVCLCQIPLSSVTPHPSSPQVVSGDPSTLCHTCVSVAGIHLLFGHPRKL